MPSSTPLSTNACARLTRRSVLALPALTGAGVVLASCGVLKKGAPSPLIAVLADSAAVSNVPTHMGVWPENIG